MDDKLKLYADAKQHKNLIAKINQLIKAVNESRVVIPDKVDIKYPPEVKITNFPEQKEVKIPEQKEFPKEIEVSNFPKQKEVKIPKEVTVKKPKWYQKFNENSLVNKIVGSLSELLEGIRSILKSHQQSKKAIAVKLVDTEGDFYTAYANFVSGGTTVNYPTPSTIYNNAVVNAAAGVRTQLSAVSVPIKSVSIKADDTNTNYIYVGNATVAAANGLALGPGEGCSLNIDDLNKVYIDSAVNGEGITYLAVN